MVFSDPEGDAHTAAIKAAKQKEIDAAAYAAAQLQLEALNKQLATPVAQPAAKPVASAPTAVAAAAPQYVAPAAPAASALPDTSAATAAFFANQLAAQQQLVYNRRYGAPDPTQNVTLMGTPHGSYLSYNPTYVAAQNAAATTNAAAGGNVTSASVPKLPTDADIRALQSQPVWQLPRGASASVQAQYMKAIGR